MSSNFIDFKDDPRIPLGIQLPVLKSGKVSYKSWHLPIDYDSLTLQEGIDYLSIVAAPQGKIPEIIRFTEGKDSFIVKQFFYGGVELKAHDCIHLLLGRGLLPKDEAFVIGFTMGSTNRLETMNKDAFAYIAGHYYPNAYKMDEESRVIYLDAAKLGHLSDVPPLDEVDFEQYLNWPLSKLRLELGLNVDQIRSYYKDIEQLRHPHDLATSRLVAKAKFNNKLTIESGFGTTLYDISKEYEQLLLSSDIPYEFNEKQVRFLVEEEKNGVLSTLAKQRQISKECFEEIKKICGSDNQQVVKDIELQRWDCFFNDAKDCVEEAAEQILMDFAKNIWKKQYDEVSLRSIVHALLGLGDTKKERAFCRGFFDGSSNRKSSYSVDLKTKIYQSLPITASGLYCKELVRSYSEGVLFGFISDCLPLMKIDFNTILETPLEDARRKINLNLNFLKTYNNL